MPLLNLKNTPILTNRPISSCKIKVLDVIDTRQSSSSTALTSGFSMVRRPPTKALYSIHDQLDDLRLKELELEKAKV